MEYKEKKYYVVCCRHKQGVPNHIIEKSISIIEGTAVT